jgi:PIN domain nuclease of toxin-antitoxin system
MLLDSHALLWYLRGDEDRVPQRIRDAIEDTGTKIAVSVVSQWELMMKALAGRLDLPDAPEAFLFDLPRAEGFRVIDLQPRHVRALPELPALHDDPFDRLIVAQALVEDLTLVTGDEVLHRYPVVTLW